MKDRVKLVCQASYETTLVCEVLDMIVLMRLNVELQLPLKSFSVNIGLVPLTTTKDVIALGTKRLLKAKI